MDVMPCSLGKHRGRPESVRDTAFGTDRDRSLGLYLRLPPVPGPVLGPVPWDQPGPQCTEGGRGLLPGPDSLTGSWNPNLQTVPKCVFNTKTRSQIGPVPAENRREVLRTRKRESSVTSPVQIRLAVCDVHDGYFHEDGERPHRVTRNRRKADRTEGKDTSGQVAEHRGGFTAAKEPRAASERGTN